MFFNKKKLVLDIGENIVRAAVFLNNSKSCTMLEYATATVKKSGSTSAAISASLGQLSSKFKKANVAINSREVFIQHILLDKAPPEQWNEQLAIEAEAYIPYDISTVNINYVHLDLPNINKNEFLLIASPKHFILQIQQDCLNAGIKCSSIESAAVSLANGFKYNYGVLENQNIALLDIQEDRSYFVSILKGQTYFVKNINFGLFSYHQALSNNLNISVSEAESLRKNFCLGKDVPEGTKNIINNTHTELQSEIKIAMQFIQDILLKEVPSNFFLTGAAISLPNLLEKISDIAPCEIINIFLNVKYSTTKIEKSVAEEINPSAATLIGLGSTL